MALEDASSNGIRYFGGEVHCLIRGGRGGSSFETGSTEFHKIVDEDPTCSPWGRTKHNDVRHDLVRDACDAVKVRVVYVRTEDQHADLFTKPLDIHKFYKHAKLVYHEFRKKGTFRENILSRSLSSRE